MAPLHPSQEFRSYSAQYREERSTSRSSSKGRNLREVEHSKKVISSKRTDSFRRQERHYLQRSDAYITSRDLNVTRQNARKIHIDLRRSIDYRRSLVVDKKVEVIYDSRPVIPEVDYESRKKFDLARKISNGLSRPSSRLSVFREKSAKRQDSKGNFPCVDVHTNLIRSKSNFKIESNCDNKESEKSTNLKSALKLSKSDTKLHTNLEVKWDSDSESKSTPISDWVSDTSTSKSENEYTFQINGSPTITRKVSQSISKSLSKTPLFRNKRRGSSKAGKDGSAPRKVVKHHLIPRVKIKQGSSGHVSILRFTITETCILLFKLAWFTLITTICLLL